MNKFVNDLVRTVGQEVQNSSTGMKVQVPRKKNKEVLPETEEVQDCVICIGSTGGQKIFTSLRFKVSMRFTTYQCL